MFFIRLHWLNCWSFQPHLLVLEPSCYSPFCWYWYFSMSVFDDWDDLMPNSHSPILLFIPCRWYQSIIDLCEEDPFYCRLFHMQVKYVSETANFPRTSVEEVNSSDTIFVQKTRWVLLALNTYITLQMSQFYF